MSVQTTYDLAAAWYRDRMAQSWNPPSPGEAEVIFERFDLTGAFWQLSWTPQPDPES
jgi:hypothetical protein